MDLWCSAAAQAMHPPGSAESRCAIHSITSSARAISVGGFRDPFPHRGKIEVVLHQPIDQVQRELGIDRVCTRRSVLRNSFLASSKCVREGEGEGHAVAYVHRGVMDQGQPVRIVPVFINTYFPPNQPWPRRCYQLGQAICKAVEAFPGDGRVGIIASGGLSHFVGDEDFDRAILKACVEKDAKFLQTLPRNKLHSGNSEILNWVGVAGAVEHLDLNWFEYIRDSRTPAGTGTGLSFANWG